MRAITVRQPWAWAIARLGKNVENRRQNIAGTYRGPVAIHAGQQVAESVAWSDPNIEAALAAHDVETDWPLTLGRIIAVIDLTDVHDEDACWQQDFRRLARLRRDDPEALHALPDNGAGGLIGRTRLCSPWAMGDHYHLTLANPRPLPEPIPAKGRPGLWTLPDDIEAAVLAQIGGAL